MDFLILFRWPHMLNRNGPARVSDGVQNRNVKEARVPVILHEDTLVKGIGYSPRMTHMDVIIGGPIRGQCDEHVNPNPM